MAKYKTTIFVNNLSDKEAAERIAGFVVERLRAIGTKATYKIEKTKK